MDKLLFFDQGLVKPSENFSPFALTDVLTAFAGDQKQPIIHFWQLDKTLILGMKDSRVPFLADGLKSIQQTDYQALLRNAGGLGVISDLGILNVSLILPKGDLSIDQGYQKVIAWLEQTMIAKQPLISGEVTDSYCPGKFDLSLAGKKIAGIAQRRVKDGVAIMMYLSVNGKQFERGEIVRDFYLAGLKKDFGEHGYPPVNPNSMTTLADAYQTNLSVEEIKADLIAPLSIDHQTDFLENFYHTEDYRKRIDSMIQRNQLLTEVTHEN